MRVTREMLEFLGACQEGIDLFVEQYPNGVEELTTDVLVNLATRGGNIDWFAKSEFFTAAQKRDYAREIASAEQALEAARVAAVARHGDPNIYDPSTYAEKAAIGAAIVADIAPFRAALIRASGAALARALKLPEPVATPVAVGVKSRV